jgi:hypothetical protein
MYLMYLLILVNGVFVDYGVRSEMGNAAMPDMFKSKAECEAQAKKDYATFTDEDKKMAKLECRKA